MSRYAKETPRITVKFVDANTEELLFEIKDRNHLNVGELFSDYVVDNIMKNHFKDNPMPENIMILAVADYSLFD